LTVVTALALGPEWLKPDTILQLLGPWALVGLAVIIFAECGLLLGFFLPGDSLLFTAGLFVAGGAIATPLWAVCALLVVAAVLGNACGYWIGRTAGPAVFDKPRSRLFKPQHVAKTQEFFDRYGNRAIVLGRFVPIVRTFITVMAGVGRMDARRYLTYSLIGGVAWAAGVTLLGFWLGQFAFVKANIELMLVAIVLVSVLPMVVEVLRARRERSHTPGDVCESVCEPRQRVRRLLSCQVAGGQQRPLSVGHRRTGVDVPPRGTITTPAMSRGRVLAGGRYVHPDSW
jgi:membrane-associated protein